MTTQRDGREGAAMAKLVLVDDEEDALTWMKAALETRGHEVKTFVDGPSALRGLEAFTPDLVVTDVLMSEMDGLTLARRIRRRFNVPVMFVSIAKKQAEAIIAGGVGFVRKPASAVELRAAVERALGHRAEKSTVLVVDDDADLLALYRTFLEPGFAVITAENGKDALEQLKSRHVDMAIVDVHMPVMNGAELIRAMRKEPALENLPVVVQTTDHTALEAPLWGTLHVAEVMSKESFLDWFEGRLGGPKS
jgi:CheY-like chemotaxis protein